MSYSQGKLLAHGTESRLNMLPEPEDEATVQLDGDIAESANCIVNNAMHNLLPYLFPIKAAFRGTVVDANYGFVCTNSAVSPPNVAMRASVFSKYVRAGSAGVPLDSPTLASTILISPNSV